MTELAPAASPEELRSALVERHGGRAALSIVDMELIWAAVRLFADMRKAPASEFPELIKSVERIEGMLPQGRGALSPLDRLREHCGAPS